ncbi:putative pectinesterase/pectinesterase inhibitor 41 [Triticum urartu]|uniref:Pectinesterase n=1 Tax=Triticum urartu TaxID=4572 RepID=M7ZUY6_TRIUA|nr:putative pectinesterase/pectinesterase inhibitor 41 [Triticum urartu]
MAAYHPAAALSFLLVLSLFLLARADPPPATPVPPSTACDDTTDPAFCRSVLPANGTGNLYAYGRFSAARSLSNANRFLGLVNRYLARGGLSGAAVAALQDCQLLSGLNIDFLSAAGATLNTTKFDHAAVLGQGFVAVNMTFRNTAGPAKHQAVALRSGADLSTFYQCSFEGYQDTLYTHSLRQFYRACDVYGTVDYVFGNAAVVFQDCTLYNRLPMAGQSNTVTAQGRSDPNQNTGTTIQGCSIVAAPELAANTAFATTTYLGRPWKMYSRTVIMQSDVAGLVDPAGWMPWSGDFALATLYYAEYDNSGAGSDTSRRVNWPGYHVLNSTVDAGNFTVANMVLGDFWLPQTGVPFTVGLN